MRASHCSFFVAAASLAVCTAGTASAAGTRSSVRITCDDNLAFVPPPGGAVEIGKILLKTDGVIESDQMRLIADALARLDSQVGGLQDDVAILTANNAALKADNVALKADNVELKADTVDLKADTVVLKADNAGLKTRVDDLEAAAAAGTPSDDDDDDDFASQLADMKANVTKLDNSVAALQSDVAELNATIANDVFEQEDGTFLAGSSLCAMLGSQILALGGDPAKPCVLPTELNEIRWDSNSAHAWISWAPLLIAVKKVKNSVNIEYQRGMKSLASLFPRLEEVGIHVSILGNSDLISMDGAFPLLRKVGGTLRVNYNAELKSLAGGFPALTTVTETVAIGYNDKLVSVGTGDDNVFPLMAPKSITELQFHNNGPASYIAFCQSAKGTFCDLGASYANSGSFSGNSHSCCQ